MSTADQTPAIREFDLGAEESFDELPAPVTVDQDEYFLTRDKKGSYRLLSVICPHNWGKIVNWDNCFMCPDHGWRFERSEGVCINGPNTRMFSFDVIVKDGNIFAQIPKDKKLWY